MGLTSFVGEIPRKADVRVAKNYLDEDELKQLNTLVSAFFDVAEFRALNREATYMKDWLSRLDRLITVVDAPTLSGAGTISHNQAVEKAELEYDAFRTQRDAEPSAVEQQYLESVKRAQRTLEGKQP